MRRISFVSLFFLLTIFYSLSCNKEDPKGLPEVITITPENLTETSARVGGIIISHKNLKISELGVCWGLKKNPTLSNSKITTIPSFTARDTIEFKAIITGLVIETNYFYRAYAMNIAGTVYGKCIMLCTCK